MGNPHIVNGIAEEERTADQQAIARRPPSASSHNCFFDLPYELLNRIFEIVCHSHDPQNGRPSVKLDYRSAISLLCTSQHINAIVTPIAYAHIRVSSPSRLLGLWAVLEAHYERRTMIRSLHIGPEDDPVPSHWPLARPPGEDSIDDWEHGPLWMRTSRDPIIARDKDGRAAPKKHEKDWMVPLHARAPGCRGKAIDDALKVALEAIDVDPVFPGTAREVDEIGKVSSGAGKGYKYACELTLYEPPAQAAWSERIVKLRIALDLYLTAAEHLPGWRVTKVPDECETETCAHLWPELYFWELLTYPPRVFNDLHKRPDIFLTPLHLQRHAAQLPKTTDTDRFDRPLIFARSGYPLCDVDIDQGGQRRISGLLMGLFDEALADEADGPAITQLRWESEHVPESATHLEPEPPMNATDQEFTSTDTVGGLLACARSVIVRAPNIVNLSLTGMFYRVLCRSQPVAMDSLRSLSIGPLLPIWNKTFTRRAMAQLPNLEQLRLCVPTLTQEEIDTLVDSEGVLGRLKKVQWEVVRKGEVSSISEDSHASFAELARRLQPSANTPASQGNTATVKRKREVYEGPERDGAAKGEEERPVKHQQSKLVRSPLHLEVLVHPYVVPQLLDEAPSREVSAAWREGKGVDEDNEAAHTIHVAESRAAQTSCDEEERSSEIAKQLYSESRRWWEKRALSGGYGW